MCGSGCHRWVVLASDYAQAVIDKGFAKLLKVALIYRYCLGVQTHLKLLQLGDCGGSLSDLLGALVDNFAADERSLPLATFLASRLCRPSAVVTWGKAAHRYTTGLSRQRCW